MTTPNITTENYHNQDERGQWDVVKIMIGDDVYIDVACREGKGSKAKARAMAGDIKLALEQTMQAHHAESSRKL